MFVAGADFRRGSERGVDQFPAVVEEASGRREARMMARSRLTRLPARLGEEIVKFEGRNRTKESEGRKGRWEHDQDCEGD